MLRRTRKIPGRPYCEAFPTLRIEDVVRNGVGGRSVLEFANELGVIVGHVRLGNRTDEALEFEHLFFSAVNVWPGRERVRIALSSRQVGLYDKPGMTCPTCNAGVGTLHYVYRRWACRKCHKLVYRTQRLSATMRLVWDYKTENDELQRETQSRRKNSLLRRMAKIEEQLGGAVPDLPAQLGYTVTGRWLSPAEQPKVTVLPDDIHYNWHPQQERGFRAFRS